MKSYRTIISTALIAGCALLAGAGVASAQSSVALTAARQSTLLPDGKTVPMWGWQCGTVTGTGASCVAAATGQPQLGPGTWQPPLITISTGSPLTITLTNSLPVQSSLVVVGQVSGGGATGLGAPTRETAPRTHAPQTSTTWPAVGGSTFTPPVQGQRARSFVQEAAKGGGTQTYTWTALNPGTYLIETGTYPSIQGPMGLYGVLVVTQAPVRTGTTAPGTAYPGINYDADAVQLLSEIDPVQNLAADTAAATGVLDETATWNPTCGKANTCYPPAVDYTPLYYLVNGVSFDLSNPAASTLQLPTKATTGNVLVRFVNAGLHMHVPSVVGSPFTLIAEDGNVQPDVKLAVSKHLQPSPKIPGLKTQSEVFLAAGKVYDVMFNPAVLPATAGAAALPGAYTGAAYSIFDRELSLSTNNRRDGGMQSFVQIGTATAGSAGGVPVSALLPAANPDSFTIAPNLTTFSANVLANDVGITGATLGAAPTHGSVALNANGSFTYTPTPTGSFIVSDSFTYVGTYSYNGGAGTTQPITVSINVGPTGHPPTAAADAYTSAVASLLKVPAPGVLANDVDGSTPPYPLTASPVGGTAGQPISAGLLTYTLNANGSIVASATAPGTYTFQYNAVNSQGTSSAPATVSLTFPAGSNQANTGWVTVQDTQTQTPITDYRWVIEQDDNLHWDPGVTVSAPTQTLATSFFHSYMPVIATGCTGPVSCGAGQTVVDTNPTSPTFATHIAFGQESASFPNEVVLDPAKYYYISILPGDAADAAAHGGGAPNTAPLDLSESLTDNVVTATVAGGGALPTAVKKGDTVTVTSTTLGYSGSWVVTAAGPNSFQYKANQTGLAAAPNSTANSAYVTSGFNPATDCLPNSPGAGNCGHIVSGAPILPACKPVAPATTCTGGTFPNVVVTAEPNPLVASQLSIFVFEDNNPTNGDVDGAEESQGLGGFQIILNDVAGATGITIGQMTYDMFNMPLNNSLNNTIDTATGLNECRIAPETLVGVILTCPKFEYDNKAQRFTRTVSPLAGIVLIKNLFPNRFDVLVKPGAALEAAGEHWIQTSTLEGTHGNDAFSKVGEPAYFQEFGAPGFHSFVGFINPAHIAAVNAAQKGKFSVDGTVTNLHMSRPSDESLHDSGSHDALSQSVCYVGLNSQNGIGANIAFTQCQPDGTFKLTGVPSGQYQLVVWDQWQDQILEYQTVNVVNSNVHFGDVPVLSWFQSVSTRIYYDNGTDNPGIVQAPMNVRFRDGQFAASQFTDASGNAIIKELFPLFNWYVMESDTTRFKGSKVGIINDAGGAVDPAGTTYGKAQGFSQDYPTGGILNSSEKFSLPANMQVPGAKYVPGKTTRFDPGSVKTEGFQAFISQPQVIEWGKQPFAAGENGGITGHVVYSSTRPYDDPTQNSQNLWDPLVPRVTVNLYQESIAADGTQSLTLIDSTTTSSWDDWASGTHVASDGSVVSNMNCPGQDPSDQYMATIGASNRYQCYDGFHDWNQIQPAPYDGAYSFPTAQCKVCTAPNPGSTAAVPLPNLLPVGRYVTEVIVPSGYQIVKEEDKNILTGDSYIAPVAQQFGAMGNVFIVPDQASLDAYNPNNTSNPTTNLGRANTGGFIAGGIIVQANPCVGQLRTVPDFLSIFPQTGLVAPFAGASRRTCERKEVTLEDQMTAKADFFIFTPTPKAAKFTGIILDDLSSEYNTTRPDFGEKFAVPFVPVSFRDFNGVEVSRTYADQFGTFNGLVYSTWEVNPPNPTGYAPNMMITCMNDPGPIIDKRPGSSTAGHLIQDPNYNPQYSNFCYTNAYMPGTTDYMDTPVLPTAAFAAGYNPVDCAYPDTTPAIARVDVNNGLPGVNGATGVGPFVPAGGGYKMTITALGDVSVPNNAYIGPTKLVSGVWKPSTGLEGQSSIIRHYGFGGTKGTVSINGTAVPTANITGWTDSAITVNVPANAKTGELVVTTANLKSTVDAITVTMGAAGEAPPLVVEPAITNTATFIGLAHPIQDAIDAARPGDMIILDAGSYPELVTLWKPLRLQGVGAASVTINAAKYPTQKLQDWRTKINALFGLDLQGNTLPGTPQVDPLPGQEITGGIVLLEPSVLSTEEGAGITVVAKNERANACKGKKPSDSNFHCHNARIDGIGVTGGDAGGGIYVNGWAHNLEISNNRVFGNSGTYTGGVRIGQPYLEGQTGEAPYDYNTNVNIHNNSITGNGTVEANNGNGGVGGGLSLNAGSDGYTVSRNYVCGNFSLGDGGGIGHLGLSDQGRITNNTVIFNQVFNQSSTTSGGGIVIEGETGTATALSFGTGNVLIDSNLIQGNHAKAGHGGGVRLQDVNGADIAASPNRTDDWYAVTLTNNMISNNVAGWAGGGISLANTVLSSIVNNTVVSNDSTATAGPVIALNIPAGQAASTSSTKQPAGISSEFHSNGLMSAIGKNAPAAVRAKYSNPKLENNIVWSNRSFNFAVVGGGSGANPGTAAVSTLQPILAAQTVAGECMSQASYWDLGILGDTSASTHLNGLLNASFSILTTGATGYAASNKTEAGFVGKPGANNATGLTSVYCNGGRADPGIPDSTPPNPAFAFQVAGTEDEGGNWVDVRYGPLSLSDPSKYVYVPAPGTVSLAPLSNLQVKPGSAAVDAGSNSGAPQRDFFNTQRPQGNTADIGAHELIQAVGNAQLQNAPALIQRAPGLIQRAPALIRSQRNGIN